MASRFVGKHTLRTEGDIVTMNPGGDISLEEIIEVHDEIKRVLVRLGRVYVLSDNRRSAEMSPEVRRFLADWNRANRVSAIAVINNGSYAVRMLATLVLRGISLLRKDSPPIRIVASEAEARRFFSSERRKFGHDSLSDLHPV